MSHVRKYHKQPGGPESEVVKYCFFQKIIVSPRRKHNSAITKTLKFRRLNLVFFRLMCISPRRNAISASNKFRHAQLSAPSFLHLLQFGHRGFRQVFVRVDESPLPHLAIKNQVRTPGMQTLWHDFFAGRPCGIYCACVRFELFSVSCDILPHPIISVASRTSASSHER